MYILQYRSPRVKGNSRVPKLAGRGLSTRNPLRVESGSGTRDRLISLWPSYRRNAPAQPYRYFTVCSLSVASPFRFGGRSRNSRDDSARGAVDWGGR